MALVDKSVLVPYRADQMYVLVERIEDYPTFLPWCGGAQILERGAGEVVARIEIRYHGVHAGFTTSNRNRPGEEIIVSLRDGPFRRLDGVWRFVPLSPDACKVSLCLTYEFSTPLLASVIGPVFSYIAGSFIEAFVARAEALYG